MLSACTIHNGGVNRKGDGTNDKRLLHGLQIGLFFCQYVFEEAGTDADNNPDSLVMILYCLLNDSLLSDSQSDGCLQKA